MTAQHYLFESVTPAGKPEYADPLGPITLPTRDRVGARALALAGTVGLSSFAAAAMADQTTWPTACAD
ncbi:hypothetical protein [Kribbella sp. HUAS MG21]|uniref:Uncharacterized protein n=1 Tax=Kribbella sp. HUAS MG21 TaxID=3160966 RepID=A0AAU7TLZ5_9ACTN